MAFQRTTEVWSEGDFDDWSEDLESFVSSSTTTHSRQLFERVFDFRLSGKPQDVFRKYTVDTYFFIPRSVGLNRDNFTRTHFYNSLSSYLRIETDTGLRRSALREGRWNLPMTDAYFASWMQVNQRAQLANSAIQEVKLFACLMETQLKLLRSQLHRALRRQSVNRESRIPYAHKKLGILLELLQTFRRLYLERIYKGQVWIEEEVRLAFILSDEFISYRLESIVIHLQELLAAVPTSEAVKLFQDWLQQVLQQEMQHRQSYGHLQIQEATHESIQEAYYYRLGLLKKYVSDVLYLEIRHLRKDKAYRHLVAVIGAALAATWAGLVDLQRFYWMQNSSLGASSHSSSDFALRFFFFVIVGVIAYIFKDRIKELSREYFYERLKHFLPDYEYSLYYRFPTPGTESAQKVGQAREYMRYLNKSALPPEIAYIREWGHPHQREPERMEEVIHFSKQILIHTHFIRHHFPHIRFIRDISRFAIDEFLLRIDEPSKKLQYFDQQRGIATIKAPKVYHINLISRYAVSEFKEGRWLPARIDFEYIRLVINKKGIVRVEQVLPRGELGYQEDLT